MDNDNENQSGTGGAAPGAQGGQSGTGQQTNNELPTDVATLQGMVLNLRRESAGYRARLQPLETELQTAQSRINELETKWASADTNTKELLEAKNTELANVKKELQTANTELARFREVEETQRSGLLAQLPESLRESYKDLPVPVLQNMVRDFGSQQQGTGQQGQQSQNVENPAGRKGQVDLDTELDKAIAAGDDKRVDEILAEMEKAS